MPWRLRIPIKVLCWLTLLAVIAWMGPGIPHWRTALAPQAPTLTRVVQLSPCPAWASTIGRWEGAYVCAWTVEQESAYAKMLREP